MLKRIIGTSCFLRDIRKSDCVSLHILLSLFILSGILSFEVTSLGSDSLNPALVDTAPNNKEIQDKSCISEHKSKTPIDFLTFSDQTKRASDRETISGSLVTVSGALALVLCTFFGLVYITKYILPRQRRRLSSSIEILDSCFLDSKNELTTIRWGGKLILLSKSHGRFSTLSELSDKEEINNFLTTFVKVKKKTDSTPIACLFKYYSSRNKERNAGEE